MRDKEEDQSKRDTHSGYARAELVEYWFRQITLTERMFDATRREAQKLVDSRLTLTLGDMAAGKRYLLKCLKNMDLIELRAMNESDGAALWARGSAGACIYRHAKRDESLQRER